MDKKKSAVIIGAGIGGIATSVFLAKNGYKVSIYEKNSVPGGRCGQLIRDGFRFDLGATMIVMPGIYRQVFQLLGIPLFETGELKKLDVLYNIYFDNNEMLVFSPDENKMKDQHEKIEQGSFKKSKKYIETGYKIYQLGLRHFLDRNFYNIFQFANLRNIGMLFKLKFYITNYAYAKCFFRHPYLRMAYTFQNIYVGQSPFTSPALFSMVPAAELTEGSFSIKGGMYMIVEKLKDAAEEAGVLFHFDCPVSEILIKDKKARSIRLENGKEISADVVVANADLPYAYRRLLPDKRKSARLDRLKYSCSSISFHWGLDKVYPQLGQHSVFLSDKYRNGLRSIFKDKLIGDEPCFYIHAPVRADLSAAPENLDNLSVVIGLGHVDKKRKQDWEQLKAKTRVAVINRLNHFGMNDIEGHIVSETCIMPEDWENNCNISRGSVFGSLAHSMFQMGYFRPHNQHDRYKNLFFTGGSTHPGNGIPNVLLSAKLTSERILKQFPS